MAVATSQNLGGFAVTWIYHGHDEKRCYYHPDCMVCFLRTIFSLIRLRKQVLSELRFVVVLTVPKEKREEVPWAKAN
jgi:hypothetical protein